MDKKALGAIAVAGAVLVGVLTALPEAEAAIEDKIITKRVLAGAVQLYAKHLFPQSDGGLRQQICAYSTLVSEDGGTSLTDPTCYERVVIPDKAWQDALVDDLTFWRKSDGFKE